MSAPLKVRGVGGIRSTCHIVREGRMEHQCETPYPVLARWTVVECDCGKQYISRRISLWSTKDGHHWARKWWRVRGQVQDQ